MFVVEANRWDEFRTLFEKPRVILGSRFTMDEVIAITNIMRTTRIPVNTKIYPPRSYYDLATDIIEKLETGNSLDNLHPELYHSVANHPVSKTQLSVLHAPLFKRYSEYVKKRGETYPKNILSLLDVKSVKDMEKAMSVMFASTILYFSKIEDRGERSDIVDGEEQKPDHWRPK